MTRHPPSRRNQGGVALILVTWVLMVLGVLALDFSRFMRDDAMAGINYAEEMQGYYLALGGMNRALLEAIQAREEAAGTSTKRRDGAPRDDTDEAPNATPVDGQWHQGEFAGGHFAVRMTDEGGKIPINKASESVLRLVLRNVAEGGSRVQGVNRREENALTTVVDSILDWRDIDNLTRPEGAEKDYYLGLPRPYRPKNGYFDSPEELLMVRGVTADLVYGGPDHPGLRDVVSVYNKTRTINARTMSAATMQMLFGLDADTAASLAAQRDGDPTAFLPVLQGQAATIDDRLQEMLVDEEPHLVQVEARADETWTRNRSSVAAVVEISGEDVDGIKIVRWLDRAPWGGVLPTPPEFKGNAG